jgi:hypothetical protein
VREEDLLRTGDDPDVVVDRLFHMSRSERESAAGAFEMTGAIDVEFDCGRIAKVTVDLVTKSPVPVFVEYFERGGFPPEEREKALRGSSLQPASIKGTFEGYCGGTQLWPFI